MKRAILIILGIVLVAAVVVGGFFGYQYLDSTINFVSTNNAEVVGQPVPVGSMNAGRLVSLGVDVGATVHLGDVLAEIELPTALRTSQNGTTDLEFVGASDQRVDVRAPIDGVVLAVPGVVGQTVSQSQPLVTLMDPSHLWITANVDEVEISKVHIGQDVQVSIAAADKTFSGKVVMITPATAASFLPAPATNATADFTQVDQLVPVRIALDTGGTNLYPGASATVTIKVASNWP